MAKKSKSSSKKNPSSKVKKAGPKPVNLSGFWANRLLQNLVIAAVAIIIYGNTLGHDFTQDDAIVITENMYTKDGLQGIGGLLKYDTFKGFFKVEGKDKLVSGGRYRPLTPILFALQWDLLKQPKKDSNGIVQKDLDGNVIYTANPFAFHLIHILFYGLCCLVLFWTLLEFLKGHKEKFRVLVSFFTALLFAVHPLHTEAVANIKGADEVITLLLSLAAFYFTLKAVRAQKLYLGIAASACLFLGLLAKENAITFLGVIPLGIYFAKGLDLKKAIPYLGMLVVAAVLFLMIRGNILGWDLGEPSRELMNNPYLKVEGNRYVDFTTAEKSATITYTLGKYLQLFIFPHPLTHDYYPRAVEIMSWSNIKVILSLFLYLLIGFLGIRSLLKKDLIGFGLLFFLGTLSIVSNVVFPVGTNMSERFMFMPSVGLCFIASLLLYRLFEKKPNTAMMMAGVLVLPILLFAYKTIDRNSAWKDNFTLFTTDIEYSPRSAKLQNSVGAELSKASQAESNPDKQKEMLNRAIEHFNAAIAIHPNMENAYLQLGNAYSYLKDPQKAISFYDKVLSLDTNDKDAVNNKAIALRDVRRFDEALQLTEQMRNLGFPKKEVDFKLAYIYEEGGKHYSTNGNLDLALSYFQKGLQFSPDKDKMTYFMGVTYALKKDYPQAIQHFERALQLTAQESNKVNIYRSLSGLYVEMGDQQKAQQYQQLMQKAAGQ